MALNIANLNARGLRDRSKAARLFRDPFSFWIDVDAIEETHFVCEIDDRVLSSDFVFYSACRYVLTRSVFFLVKGTLVTSVDLVDVDVGVPIDRCFCEQYFVSDRCGLCG